MSNRAVSRQPTGFSSKKMPERLHMCKICCTFVADFGKKSKNEKTDSYHCGRRQQRT